MKAAVLRTSLPVLVMGMVWLFVLVTPPALAASFPSENESCNEEFWGEPICLHTLESVTLSSSASGQITIAWEPIKTPIRWLCGPYMTPSDCLVQKYKVYSSKGPDTPTGGGTCETGAAAPHSCSIDALRDGHQYTFRVVTFLGNGHRFWSPEIGPISPCCSVAAAPTDVQVTQVGAALDVTWAASKDWGGATTLKYVVTTDPPSVSCTSEILTCRLEGLVYAKAYKVLVASKNDAGESTPVGSAATYTIPSGPPDSPTISSVKFGVGKGAKVSWVAPERTGGLPVKKYTATAHPGGATCSTTGAQTCTIAGLSAGKSYSFTATASNSKGMSKASALSVAGKLTGPGVLVRSPIATASGTAATVSWQTPSSSAGGALVTYVVKASGNGGTCSTKNTSCRILGLRPGGTYEFAVKTVRTGGASAPVSTVAITMPAPAIPEPPKPTQVLS